MLSGVGGATRNKWSAPVQWSLWPATGCVRSLRTQQRAQCQMPKTSVVGLLSRGYRSRDSFGITIEVVVNDHANTKQVSNDLFCQFQTCILFAYSGGLVH